MLPFGESFLAIAAALAIPAFLGLLIVAGVAKFVSQRYLVAFSLGIYLWFFSDTIGDTAYLDVNSGFSGDFVQIATLILFAVGLILVFSLDRTMFKPEPTTNLSLAIPFLAALAVGFHGFGEGAEFSATAAATPSTSILDAFGGFSAAVAFLLHKGLEPMMVGAIYWTYAKDRVKNSVGFIGDMLLLTLIFIIPGLVGGATDYFMGYETTYFFAFGLGASIYAAVRLAKPLFWGQVMSNSESTKVALMVLLGFLCIYFAALFHS